MTVYDVLHSPKQNSISLQQLDHVIHDLLNKSSDARKKVNLYDAAEFLLEAAQLDDIRKDFNEDRFVEGFNKGMKLTYDLRNKIPLGFWKALKKQALIDMEFIKQ